MAIYHVPEGQKLWQAVASAYRPPNQPYAMYAADERIGALHAGTLAINFAPGVNTLSLHNAWLVSDWPDGYPLRVPDEGRAAAFPRMLTPEEVAKALGYSLDPGSPDPILPPENVRPSDVPAWVQAYYNWLQNQVDVYGVVVRREKRPEFAR